MAQKRLPSAWVERHAHLIPPGASVLDLACGHGRHTRYLLDRGFRVTAVDRDLAGIADLAGHTGLEMLEVDLEEDRPFALAGRHFGGVVVTNYLHRRILPALVSAVGPAGLLIYETFARGQEQFGPPTRPDFLLEPGELLDAVRGRLRVLAYEDLVIPDPRPHAVQRIVALLPPGQGLGSRHSVLTDGADCQTPGRESVGQGDQGTQR